MEGVDADHRVDAGRPDGVDVVHHVGQALLQSLQVFFGVGIGQGRPGDHLGAAAVHLQRPDGGGEHRHVWFEAAEAALDVPELLEADIGGEAALGDMIIKHLEADAVGDDGGLAHGDVGKGAGMHHAGLILRRAAQGGVDGVAHPGGHGAADFEVAGGDRLALLIVGHGDLVHSLPQVGQVPDDGEHGHQLGAYGDAELGLHQEAVHLAADADDDVAQALGAEVHNPAHLHPGGVDVQAAQVAFGQFGVIIVALMLHPGGKGYHGQVVGIHNVVDVAGESHGELGHGDEQGIAAAGSSSLDIHGGAARGLADTAAYVLASACPDPPSDPWWWLFCLRPVVWG